MELAILILLIVLILLVAAGLVLFLLKANKPQAPAKQDPAELKAILDSYNEVKVAIETMKASLKAETESAILKQMHALTESMKAQNEQDNSRLVIFQKTILDTMNTRIDSLNKKVDDNLAAINAKVDKTLSEGFKGNSETMATIREQLGAITEAQNNIKSLSDEVIGLRGVLTNNQQRGRYGEMQLEMLLEASFGETKGILYDTQYVLPVKGDDGENLKPDAVVFLDGSKTHNLIAIDSKFSLVGYDTLFSGAKLTEEEIDALKKSFKTALKLRIKEVSRYIIPGLTVKNAVMFIPNDGIFAFVENEFSDLVDEAIAKGVVLASPTILQPMIVSFRVVQADAEKSRNIEKINESLTKLGAEFKRFSTRWTDLSRAARILNDKASAFGTTVAKIDRKFSDLSQGKTDALGLEEEEEVLGIGTEE